MKESIIDGAFAVFRKYGYENLNARSLAREMNCSNICQFQGYGSG